MVATTVVALSPQCSSWSRPELEGELRGGGGNGNSPHGIGGLVTKVTQVAMMWSAPGGGNRLRRLCWWLGGPGELVIGSNYGKQQPWVAAILASLVACGNLVGDFVAACGLPVVATGSGSWHW